MSEQSELSFDIEAYRYLPARLDDAADDAGLYLHADEVQELIDEIDRLNSIVEAKNE